MSSRNLEFVLLWLTQTRILWAARDLQELLAAARYPCVELLLRDADVRAGGPERGPAGLANVRRGFVLSDARLPKPERYPHCSLCRFTSLAYNVRGIQLFCYNSPAGQGAFFDRGGGIRSPTGTLNGTKFRLKMQGTLAILACVWRQIKRVQLRGFGQVPAASTAMAAATTASRISYTRTRRTTSRCRGSTRSSLPSAAF